MPGTGRALCELFGDDRGFLMRRLHNLHVSIGCVHHGRRIGLSGSRAAGVCESWSARGFPRTDARPSSVPTVTFQTARGARQTRIGSACSGSPVSPRVQAQSTTFAATSAPLAFLRVRVFASLCTRLTRPWPGPCDGRSSMRSCRRGSGPGARRRGTCPCRGHRVASPARTCC